MTTTTITPSLRHAWRFFLAHAGYCTPPGRAACALSLARAERNAREAGLRFLWTQDFDGPPDTFVCACVSADQSDCLAALGGIEAPSEESRRVIEAELAQEALSACD